MDATEPHPPAAPGTRALSRHTDAGALRFDVAGRHLNAWCRMPGGPFADGLLLLPNPPDEEPPSVTFSPLPAGCDCFSLVFVSPPRPRHANHLAVSVRLAAAGGELVAEARTVLRCGARAPVTLHLPAAADGGGELRVGVSFDRFEGGPVHGSVRLRYMVGYRDNELVRLFNRAGSDKGTEVYWGGGVPHCYALVYAPLLEPLRGHPVNVLEIGLDTASQGTGRPTDAPSLRAWRAFLPRARLYGYDRNDFGFLDLPDTWCFQGDQGDREDLRRFLRAHGSPRFHVVVDDGSHAPSDQQVSLAALLEHVEPGGRYFIEDLNWQPGDQEPTTLEVLRRFLADGRVETPFLTDAEARRLERLMADVTIERPNDSELAVITRSSS